MAAQQDIESKTLNFWKPHLLYLQPDECKSLYVELNAVEGCEPNQETIARLRAFLTQYCDKPESIRIVSNPPIARSDSRVTRPEILSLRHMNVPESSPERGSSAYLHVLFYDSSELIRKDGQATNPHVQMLPYPSAIYIDTQYVKDHGLSRCIPDILIHEVGHVLGLTWSRDAYSHCSDRSCLMYRTYSVNRLPMQKPVAKGLCQKCRQCLVAARTQEADSRLSFQGPMMIRSEKNYHVLSLPGFMKLHFGPLETVNWKDVLKEARAQVPKLAPQPQSVAVMMSEPQPGEAHDIKLQRALESAKNDPCSTVRLGVIALGRPAAKQPAPYKNSRDLLAKWY